MSDRDIVQRCTRLWHEPILARRGIHQRGLRVRRYQQHTHEIVEIVGHGRLRVKSKSAAATGGRVSEQSTYGRWRRKRNDSVLPRDRARESNVEADELVLLQRVGGVPGEKQPDVRLARCIGLESEPEVAQVLPLCDLQGQRAYFGSGYKESELKKTHFEPFQACQSLCERVTIYQFGISGAVTMHWKLGNPHR